MHEAPMSVVLVAEVGLLCERADRHETLRPEDVAGDEGLNEIVLISSRTDTFLTATITPTPTTVNSTVKLSHFVVEKSHT